MKPLPLVAGAAGFFAARRYAQRRVDELRVAAMAAQDEGGAGYRAAADRFFAFQRLAGILPLIVSLGVAKLAERLRR